MKLFKCVNFVSFGSVKSSSNIEWKCLKFLSWWEKMAQLLLLQLVACLLKAVVTHNTQKEVRRNAKGFILNWNNMQDWIYHVILCNFKGYKKMKNRFFIKKKTFSCLSKLGICFVIYVAIDCMPMSIARFVYLLEN